MKLSAVLAVAAALALGGCRVTTQDNSAAPAESNSSEAGAPAGSVLPVTDESSGTDTLGNQLNQLNASDSESAAANESASDNADSAGGGNQQ